MTKRGRPRELPLLQGGLVLAVDISIEVYRARGLTERQARKAAFDEALSALSQEDAKGYPLVGSRRAISMETLERYFRAGVASLRPGEMRLVAEIDASGISVDGVDARRYRRGKRALRALREYSRR